MMRKKSFVGFTAILSTLLMLCGCMAKEQNHSDTYTKPTADIAVNREFGGFLGEVQPMSTQSVQGVPMNMYNPALDTGFTLTNKVDKTVFNASAYTSLNVCVEDGGIKYSTYNGFPAYGIVGTSVGLQLKINYSAALGQSLNGTEYMLCDDTAQSVNGIVTGAISSGALVIQTSSDGKNWSNENKAKYTDGLYTTNYYSHYKTGETIIYQPDGQEVSRGVYVRVLYAYEVYDYISCQHPTYFLWWQTGYKHDNDNDYVNYVEEYSFYLCSNSAQNVTFHNLSLGDQIEENLKEEDASIIEVAKATETLTDGSVTVTGFLIDNSLNQAASITVKRNHQDYTIPENYEIRENGRYDITVRTALGEEAHTTIFVHSGGKEELYSLYFGDSFISAKRIYSKDSLPVYEGKLTFYILQAVEDIYPYIWGTITNKTTGNVITIDPTGAYHSACLTDAGAYEAKFYTNSTYGTESASGDNHTFVFRFNVIEWGTAPGPQVNQESLQNYSKLSNPTNLHPTYYGVTFQSSYRGNITLAFSSQKAAVDYAYNYEKGMVEVQADGSFRYNGSLAVSQKVKYDSAWDLTDAVYYFAEQAVQKLKFDLRDEFTYLTLSDEVLSSVENLRTLELTKSVVVFADQTEKDGLLLSGSLPILNAKKYAYLTPGVSGEVVSGYNDYMFIKDKDGYDSNSVVIIDAAGNRFDIEYNVSVDEQLRNFGVKTGVVTIEEKTVYGDIATYKAVYIAEGDNSAEVEIEGYDGKKKIAKHFDINNNNQSLELNAFAIKSVVDDADSYGMVIVSKKGVEDFYSLEEVSGKLYTEEGTYVITVVNRLGYSYSFTVRINEEIYYKTEIIGDGIDGSQYIMYADGGSVSLPKLTRYGYNFAGYKTANGNVYSDEVQAILLKGSSVLEAVWVAKQFNMTLQMEDGMVEAQTITFGETYTLPTLTSTKNRQFLGWKNASGEMVSSVTVEEEGDICLTAYFETDQEATAKENRDTSKDRVWWVWAILIGLAILGAIGPAIIAEITLEDWTYWFYIIGIPLLVISVLCMIRPNIFWWLIWWYY